MLLLTNDDLKSIKYNGLTNTKKSLGIAYLGSVAHSPKFQHSLDHGIATYSIYLASSDISGYKVCPNDKHCKEFCLNGSGRVRMELSKGGNHIMNSRIKKTRLFFLNRDLFMELMIAEIKLARITAELDNYEFSVRLNGTSDICIEDFVYKGKNILEIFPDVQFYDYTKVFNRLEMSKKYDNYDLTYSFNGYNWNLCRQALKNGFRVAVVFENELPKIHQFHNVINGDKYDARYKDPKNVIVGLKYKMTNNSVVNGKFTIPDTAFVVRRNNIHNQF